MSGSNVLRHPQYLGRVSDPDPDPDPDHLQLTLRNNHQHYHNTTTLCLRLVDGRSPIVLTHPIVCYRCNKDRSDVKELIPEMFCCPEAFLNTNNLPLGELQEDKGQVQAPDTPFIDTPS